jgi:hypothetical protein
MRLGRNASRSGYELVAGSCKYDSETVDFVRKRVYASLTNRRLVASQEGLWCM